MSSLETLIHRRVTEARAGTNPTVVARMKSGWAVVADRQITHAYCLLLPDPVVPSLNDLRDAERAQFLSDMALLGDALLRLTCAVRINYEILGNTDPALHAHVIPRYATEPEELRQRPIWFYDWNAVAPLPAQEQQQLREQVRKQLAELGGC